MLFARYAAAALLPLSALVAPAYADNHATHNMQAATYAPITVAEVEAAQKAWGDALVAISMEYETKGFEAAKDMAEDVLDAAYGYNMGPVLFKPTLAYGEGQQTFRTSRDGALSYFVGRDPNYKIDGGFALKGWRKVEPVNAGIIIAGNTATSMGHVKFTDKNGNVTVVDKTWTYARDGEGKLRIIVHHSSIPYSPK